MSDQPTALTLRWAKFEDKSDASLNFLSGRQSSEHTHAGMIHAFRGGTSGRMD